MMCTSLAERGRPYDEILVHRSEDDWISGIISQYPKTLQALKESDMIRNVWPQDWIEQLLNFEALWHLHLEPHHHGGSHIKHQIIIVAFLGGKHFAGLTTSHEGHGYRHICNGSRHRFHTMEEAIKHIEHHHHHHHSDHTMYVSSITSIDPDRMFLHAHQFDSRTTPLAAAPESDLSIIALKEYLKRIKAKDADNDLKVSLKSVYKSSRFFKVNKISSILTLVRDRFHCASKGFLSLLSSYLDLVATLSEANIRFEDLGGLESYVYNHVHDLFPEVQIEVIERVAQLVYIAGKNLQWLRADKLSSKSQATYVFHEPDDMISSIPFKTPEQLASIFLYTQFRRFTERISDKQVLLVFITMLH